MDRLRWDNIARAAALLGVIALVVAWPHLRRHGPSLPPAAATPVSVEEAPAAATPALKPARPRRRTKRVRPVRRTRRARPVRRVGHRGVSRPVPSRPTPTAPRPAPPPPPSADDQAAREFALP